MTSFRAKLLSGLLPYFMAILVAAAGCVAVAFWAKDRIEAIALNDLNLALGQSGFDWANVTVDGLSAELTGTAPDEATRFAGYGAELAARIQKDCFYHLEAPIGRVAGWDTPYPHAFEWQYFPGLKRLASGMRRVLEAE